jgi:hypothetical protein
MTWTNLFKSALIAVPLTALAWAAPTAHADPDPLSVSAYLATLNQTHVPYDNPGRMIDLGSNVCQQARDGIGFDAVYQTVAGNGFTAGQSGYIMGAAVGTFCPDMQPALDSWSNSG